MAGNVTDRVFEDPLGGLLGAYESWVRVEAAKEAAKTPSSSQQAQNQVTNSASNEVQNPNAQTQTPQGFLQERVDVGGVPMNKAGLYLAMFALVVVVLLKVVR